ncbi:hypothetical protein DL771_010895 [Monosporascus sp. 5C6A]|nr:hypothetical protein DL771_010895 [Monosporascus sp. 5C6A]
MDSSRICPVPYKTGTSVRLIDSENEDGFNFITAFTVSIMTKHTPWTSLGDPQSCMNPFPNKIREVAVPAHKLGWNFSFVHTIVAMDDVILIYPHTPLE